MSELTAEQIGQRCYDLNLVDDRQLQEVWGALGRRDVPAEEFIQFLVRRQLLTNYQIERLVNGERGGYFYGPYKVLYRVASGSFARVYRAVHKDSGKVVALKVLRRRYSDDPNQTDQFLKEGEMGRALRHPNIVPIQEVHSQNGNHFLVMDFVEGGNLRDFLKIRGKLSPAEATRLMTDVVAGMHYASERGVRHRDLKLTNILVSSRGQARLVDFGLAAAEERPSDEESIAKLENPRTIDYAGLERATGVRKDDPRSDIYFLGCIYYHLLTGEAPLQETRERIQRLARSRFTDVVPIHRVNPSIPRVVAMVVNKAMELDPEKRYQSPGDMLVDLKIAAERLAAGDDTAQADAPGELVSDAERQRIARAIVPTASRRAILFVESSAKMQDSVRDGLKSAGYRVLVISDPERALQRLQDDPRTADGVIFSAAEIGADALAAFEQCCADERTKNLPAAVLLGPKQRSWQPAAPLAAHQRRLQMPLKLRDLRRWAEELVPLDAPPRTA